MRSKGDLGGLHRKVLSNEGLGKLTRKLAFNYAS